MGYWAFWLVIAQAENHKTPSDELYGTGVTTFNLKIGSDIGGIFLFSMNFSLVYL